MSRNNWGGEFSQHSIAPGDSLLLLKMERGVPKGVGAVELIVGDDKVFRISVFGLLADAGSSTVNAGAEIESVPLGRFMMKLGLNELRRMHPLELFLRENEEATEVRKPYQLLINTPRITVAIRSKTALVKGEEYRIEAAIDGAVAHLSVVDVASDHLVVRFTEETEEHILLSSDTFIHGFLTCFVAYAPNVGWFLWVANAKSVTLEDVPFTLRTTGTDLDMLMRTANSLPVMRVVEARPTTAGQK